VDGDCTTSSAYNIQFTGIFSKIRLTLIWKARIEQKCKFSAWSLLHLKILTANNLLKRGWPNDPICKLCGMKPETPQHLCKDYIYTKETWAVVQTWCDIPHVRNISQSSSIYSYWRRCRSTFDKLRKTVFDGIIIYFWWHIWKECNRRTFEQKTRRPREVVSLCKDNITQYNWAMHNGDTVV
jgi:hypothetical protein